MTDQQVTENISKPANPLIFISHDTRDGDLAEAFSVLLKSVSAGVLKSFRSSDRRGTQGIEYGVEWYPEIIRNIQGASDVVCLLTQRSIDRPWILFEAGMAKGKLDTPILGIALGIELKEVSSGPFAQFQNCSDDEDSLTKLVFQLVKRIPNSEPDQDTIRFQVGKFKQNIKPIIEQLNNPSPQIETTNSPQNKVDIENSSAKLFEEIKIMFQDLPSRIERIAPQENKRRKNRIIHYSYIEKLMMSQDPKNGLRVALSLFREKMPWVYDAGANLINMIESSKGQSNITKRTYQEFEDLVMFSIKSGIADILTIDDKEEFYMMDEMSRVILRGFERMLIDRV